MKKLLVVILLVCCSSTYAQNTAAVHFGSVEKLYSPSLGEDRDLWVYVPWYDTTYFSRPSFPVLYVLDGDAYFPALVTLLQQLSAVNGNTVLPEMIVVGIANTPGHRNRDLTPTRTAEMPGSGGGKNFAAFLQTELVPYIDAHYPTAPYRILAGHSLGGLTVINTLLQQPASFNAYAALDPSMFYADDWLLKRSEPLLAQDFTGQSLYLAYANTLPPGMDTTQARTDTSAYTHHLRSILRFRDYLQQHPNNHLQWSSKFYPDDDHASMTAIAFYDALRYIFRDNRFPRNQPMNQYFDQQISPDSMHALITAHYQQVSNARGYVVKPPEPVLNQFGYIFLQQKDMERAKMFFQTNIDYYPYSFNAYDSMGDYFLALHNKTNAIVFFKKALGLHFSAEIKKKLDKLKPAK